MPTILDETYRFQPFNWSILVNPLFHNLDNDREPTLNGYCGRGARRFFQPAAASTAKDLSIGGISKTVSGQPSFFH